MVKVKKLEVEVYGLVSTVDLAYAVLDAAVRMWLSNRGVLQRVFNKKSMERAGLGRIN